MSRQGYQTAQWEGNPPPIEQRPWWNVRHPTAEKSPHGHDKDTPFLWMISSNHVAPGFCHPSTQENSPWCLLLRFMPMDLPYQLEHDAGLRSWADHLVPQNKAASYALPMFLTSNNRDGAAGSYSHHQPLANLTIGSGNGWSLLISGGRPRSG
ncbi:hypothetical protein CKAH01_16035 [Colletotrichum kahawae]|uniref:Uncharacterized protein n=1 Tax=Colletotrichum kahawae TaxID=34407 RepID=A0AAD9YGH7_COLKA|nr:hypothetical protein CKAH01_16035 [Colletotrichum kahawae]